MSVQAFINLLTLKIIYQIIRNEQMDYIQVYNIQIQFVILKGMLKTLDGKGHETAVSKTVIKDMRKKLFDSIIIEQQLIPDLWQKKSKVTAYKTKSGDDRKSEHLVVHSQKTNQQTHFIHVEGFVVPSLKTVHSYPTIYPKFICDSGALRFIMKGANVMSPGLTNQQSHMDDVKSGTIVAIYVHGHQHALALGVTVKSTQQIKQQNQGVAVDTIHFIGDGFWNLLYKK